MFFMSNYLKGVLLAGSTGLMWALTTPITKLMWGEGVMIASSVLLRMVIVVLAIGCFLLLKHPDQLRVRGKDLAVLFFSAIGPTGLYLGFLLSVVYLNVATAVVLHYTFPVVTALCSSLVTGEKTKCSDWAAALLVTAGVACSVLTTEWKLNTAIDIRGILWGLLAVVGLASETLLGRASFTKGGMSNWAQFFYSHFFGIFWISIYITYVGSWHNFAELSVYGWALMLTPCFIGCLLGYTAYYASLRFIPAAIASLSASVEIIGAVGLTSMITEILPTVPEMAGCALIFAAIVLIFLFRSHDSGVPASRSAVRP